MDAVKFIEERIRMCKTYFGCSGCPACDNGSCRFSVTMGDRPDKQIEIVTEWAAAHPRKTRQSVFLEQWPNARLDKFGSVAISPCFIDEKEYRNKKDGCKRQGMSCYECRLEFWMQEVE